MEVKCTLPLLSTHAKYNTLYLTTEYPDSSDFNPNELAF